MDITNMDSSERSRMKHLLQHVDWIGCGNHSVVEITKWHFALSICYKSVLIFWLQMQRYWLYGNFFTTDFLATNSVKNAAEMYDKKQVTPICSSVTKWTTHDQAYKNICNGFKQIVSALATCVNERKEPDALGIFVEITSPKFLATILILRDIFARVQPLNLTL